MIPELAKHAEKLAYFYQIIEQGSIQATARKLGLSASTLTYTIKELERVCGVELLVRSKKGMTPTPAGERLTKLCQSIFEEMERAQLQMSDLELNFKRKIRIGTFPSIAIYFWPQLLKELKAESALAVSISTNRSRYILEQLMKQEIDISLTVESFQHELLARHLLYRDTYSFFSAKDYDVSRTDSVLYYIPDASDQDGKTLKQYVYSLGAKFGEICELDSFEVILEFVRKGYGVGILPNRVASLHLRELKLQQFKGIKAEFGPHRFFLSYRKDLDIKKKELDLILSAAQKAVTRLFGGAG